MNKLGLALTVLLAFALNVCAQVPAFATLALDPAETKYSEDFAVFAGDHLYSVVQVTAATAIDVDVEYQVSYQRGGPWYAPPTPLLVNVTSSTVAEDSLALGDGEIWVRYKVTNNESDVCSVVLRAGLGGVQETEPLKNKPKLFTRLAGKEATLTVPASGSKDSEAVYASGFDAVDVFLTNSLTTGTWRFMRSATAAGPYFLMPTTALAASQYGTTDSLGGGDAYYKVRVANTGGAALTSAVKLFAR